MTRRLQFQNGQQIPVGREVVLRSVTIGWLSLYDRELADRFQAEVFETDRGTGGLSALALLGRGRGSEEDGKDGGQGAGWSCR